jgi:hypothetical protein
LRLSASWLGGNFSGAKFLHHGGELLERDLTVTISIDLLDNFVDGILAEGLTEAQNFLDLLG